MLDEAEREIFAVTGENVKADLAPIKAPVLDAIDQIEKLYENRRPTYLEHEYFRMGAWTYLAAWDIHLVRVFGHCSRGSACGRSHGTRAL